MSKATSNSADEATGTTNGLATTTPLAFVVREPEMTAVGSSRRAVVVSESA